MLHDVLLWCQWPGCVLGIIGAVYATGTTNQQRYFGFFLWVLSDLFWLAYGWEAAAYGVLASFAYFTLTSLRGMWSNREIPLEPASEIKVRPSFFDLVRASAKGSPREWVIDRFLSVYDRRPTDQSAVADWLQLQALVWRSLTEAERVIALRRLQDAA